MDENSKQSDEVRTTPKRGSGNLLAAARKQQNRSVEEIADELNLSASQIRTIELDQNEGLPEPTYVRGYIRSYAKVLGLDPNRVLEHYLNPNWQQGSRLDDMPRGIGSARDSDGPGFWTLTKVLVLLVIAGVIAFIWFSGQSDTAPDETRPATPESNVSDQRPPQSGGVQSQPAAAVDPAIPAQSAAEEVPATDATVAKHELTLNFNDTSWVDIRDAEGQRLAYKSYTAGETLEVSSATAMSVFIGNAKAVTALYNGQDYDISQHREGVFARFSIGE